MNRSFLKNSPLLALILSFGIVLFLILISPFLSILNREIQNSYYKIKDIFEGEKTNNSIVIIGIDDQSLETIGNFPFNRSYYVQALRNLQKYETALTAFDILFLDPSENTSSDEDFAMMLSGSRSVLASSIGSNGEYISPLSLFLQNGVSSGYVAPQVEKKNNTVYSFVPEKNFGNQVVQHFDIEVLKKYYSYFYDDISYLSKKSGYEGNKNYFLGDQSFPLDGSGKREILINYQEKQSFPYISFSDVLDEGKLSKINESIGLKDKIILIGPAAEGLKDEFYTPNGIEYGVFIHANILSTLLSGETMTYFQKYLEWFLILGIVIVSVFLNVSQKTSLIIFGNIGIILIFWVLFPLSILLSTNLILNYPTQIIFSFIFSLLSAVFVKFLLEDANKQALNTALSEYVSEDIASAILSGSSHIHLDGEKRNVICFFSDIENFTSLSEKLSPEDLVAFLREYLNLMTQCIMDFGGYIDKYEGDAIMALWGVFEDISDDMYISVCSAALKQQQLIQEKSESWEKSFGQKIKVRMGIHSGDVIIGNIGAKGKKMNFTALGDNVNLASRLESINKFYGTYICVSETIYEKTKKKFGYRKLDKITVKGKEKVVEIFELRGEKGEKIEGNFLQDSLFEEALDLYFGGDFKQALIRFESLGADDASAKKLYERCKALLEKKPENWDGIWRYEDK